MAPAAERVSRAIASVLALALGACSGQAASTPVETAATDFGLPRAAALRVGRVGVYPTQSLARAAEELTRPAHERVRPVALAAKPTRYSRFNYLFLSGSATGNVDAYDTSTGGFLGECQGCGGWGLATDGKNGDVAMASAGGVVTVWHVTNTLLTPYATLTLSGGGSWNALGMAFDRAGNLYATDYPGASVDEFQAATIAAGGGGADHTYALPGFTTAYYVTGVGPNLLVDGWDSGYNFVVADLVIKGAAGKLTVLQNLGTLSNGTGFPGGLSIDKHEALLVDNQYAGTVSTFAKPWTGAPTSMLSWGHVPDDYTGIVLDQLKDTLWAADIYTSGSATTSFGVANSYPLGSIGFTTAPPVNDEYVAVTVSPLKH
jgi:hypothetical protein